MIQPATLMESSERQQNSSYFNRDAVQLVLLLQLQLLIIEACNAGAWSCSQPALIFTTLLDV
jgi:hypothetical protein